MTSNGTVEAHTGLKLWLSSHLGMAEKPAKKVGFLIFVHSERQHYTWAGPFTYLEREGSLQRLHSSFGAVPFLLLCQAGPPDPAEWVEDLQQHVPEEHEAWMCYAGHGKESA